MVDQVFQNVFVGSAPADKVYVGATLVWERIATGDFFTETFRENF